MIFNLFDVVKIKEIYKDFSNDIGGLDDGIPTSGDIATIVEIFDESKTSYLLKCADNQDKTYGFLNFHKQMLNLKLYIHITSGGISPHLKMWLGQRLMLRLSPAYTPRVIR